MTPQQMIREWIKQETQGVESVDLRDLTERARVRFGDDQEFRDALVTRALEEMVPAEARAVFSRQRRVALGDEHVTRQEFERQVMAESRWGRWFEAVADNRHVSLLAMTKKDLMHAATQRETRAATEIERAMFLRKLAAGIKRPGQTVGEAYTLPELDRLWAKNEKREAA